MSSQELQALLHAVASGPGLALLARGVAKGLGQDPGAIWPVTAEQDAGRPPRQDTAAVEDAHGPGKSCLVHGMQCGLSHCVDMAGRAATASSGLVSGDPAEASGWVLVAVPVVVLPL